MLIGYARISTDDQNLNLQQDSLKQAGCETIFEDTLSGAIIHRPGLVDALKFLRSGDTLVIWRLDRLSRTLKDLIETINLLESRKIGLKSLQESIDTSSSSGKLIFHIFASLAEFERNLIRDRTKAGLDAARARGKLGGRPKSLTNDKQKLAIQLYNDKQHSIQQICDIMGITKPTLYRYIRQ